MIKKKITTIALEAYDEIPHCRKCCIRWGECRGKMVMTCHLAQTILKIQEDRHNIIYTLGGQRVTEKTK